MIRREVTISNLTGFHLGPAGVFCNIANRFKCKVLFEYDSVSANAKSLLSILGAGVKTGDTIVVVCDGEDEEEAMETIVREIEKGLGEL